MNKQTRTWKDKKSEDLNPWEQYQKKHNFVETNYPVTDPYRYGCDLDPANPAFYIKDYSVWGKNMRKRNDH